MTTALATGQPQDLAAIERVIVAGDLSKLTPPERWNYYKGVCQSVGLNPFTQPFLYITLSGKLVLYATKGAADQLRSLRHISITQPKVEMTDGLCIVTVTGTDRSGRTDSELGIVPIENLRGDAKANAILKAVTKAKRRVTLSMCGLGMLDETEVDTIPNARRVNEPVIPPEEMGAEVVVSDDGAVVKVVQTVDVAPLSDEYPNLTAQLDQAPEAETTDIWLCDICEAELHEVTFKDGTVWTPEHLAQLGQRKHENVLCMAHYREANAALKAAQEASAPHDEPAF